MDEEDSEMDITKVLSEHPKLAKLFAPIAQEAVDNGAGQCEDCGGDGYQTCEYCGGDGERSCGTCDGDGTVDCSHCGGEGSLDCPECGGEGRIRSTIKPPPEEVQRRKLEWDKIQKITKPALRLKREREFTDRASKADIREEPCEVCDGEGTRECPECDGNKTESCDDCSGAGTWSCDECDDGHVECSSCGGSGGGGMVTEFLNEAQRFALKASKLAAIKLAAFVKTALNVPRLIQDFGPKLVAKYNTEFGFSNEDTPEAIAKQAENIITVISRYDPTPNKEYTAWMTGNYTRGDIPKFENITDKMLMLLERFTDLKKLKLLNQDDRDIGKIKGLAGLEKIVSEYAEVLAVSNRKKRAELEKHYFHNGDAELFYNDDEIKIIIPKTVETAKFFGVNTKWCTAAREDSSNSFNQYNNDGPLYIVLIKADDERYQLHFESAQFMDEEDHQMDIHSVLSLHPKLAKIFLPMVQTAIDNDMAECDECDGRGSETCEYCDGEGNRECRYCDGSGNVSCENCGRHSARGLEPGQVQCGECEGSGTIYDQDELGNDTETECGTCDGEGWTACDDCDGEGNIQCGNCEGNGSVGCDNCEEGRVECRECGGTGHSGPIEEFLDQALRWAPEADKQTISVPVTASHYTLVEAFVKNYEHEVDFYQECASIVQDKLDSAIQDAGIKAVVSSRAKRPSRLGKKLEKRDESKHYQTFREIYDDIVDLAGVRVALYMPHDREAVGGIIQSMFTEVRPVKHFPKDRARETRSATSLTITSCGSGREPPQQRTALR